MNKGYWSNLLPDIQDLIMSNMDKPEDAIHFSLTCKSFRKSYIRCRAFFPENDSPMSPHLMFRINRLYDPNDNTYYYVEEMKTVKSCKLRDSNHGWLLMTKHNHNIFFYSPAYDEKIDLPDSPGEHAFLLYHFIAPPTSDKCKVICVGHTTICLIERGQEKWQVHQHTPAKHVDFFLKESRPVLLKGVLYCLGIYGDLMTFDLQKKTFSFTRCHQVLRRQLEAMYADGYLVENDGNLLCVFVYRDGTWVAVYRLNMETMMFERIYTLGNNVLYVSRYGCFSEKASTIGNNKIFIPMSYDGFCLFYSLETHKFHTINGYCTDNFYDGPECYDRPHWIKPIYTNTCNVKCSWLSIQD